MKISRHSNGNSHSRFPLQNHSPNPQEAWWQCTLGRSLYSLLNCSCSSDLKILLGFLAQPNFCRHPPSVICPSTLHIFDSIGGTTVDQIS